MVARGLDLKPGQELLTSNHEHGGVSRMWEYFSQRRGFEVKRVSIPVPVSTHANFVERFWREVSSRTRVIFLSHITSPTGLIFPVAEICRRARDAGIMTIIDGSHAPGQIPLNLRGIDPDFYVGITHKWLCAPRGSAFLYVRPDQQESLEPLVVSWGGVRCVEFVSVH